MNHVERFRALMAFQPVDRLPRLEWATWWNQTIERWHKEGLPSHLNETFEIDLYFDLDPHKQFWFNPRLPSLPAPDHHGAGVIASSSDYERLRQHLFPPVESLLGDLAHYGELQARGECVIWFTVDGYFWYPRTLLGIERHLYAFYDQADLMHRMNSDLVDWEIELVHAICRVCRPVYMTFAEDMSYNHGPMLSKKLFDDFVAPYYRRIVPVLREYGILPIIDSDGDITKLVPWFAKVDVHGFLPLERQAGVDLAALRADHPELRLIGHFDKMTMTQGEAVMRAEFERLLPAMRQGGFIPSVDHQTPPGVSLEQYRTYLNLLWEYTNRV